MSATTRHRHCRGLPGRARLCASLPAPLGVAWSVFAFALIGCDASTTRGSACCDAGDGASDAELRWRSDASPADRGAGTSADASTTCHDAGGGCTCLVNNAPTTRFEQSTAMPPRTPAGGTVRSGIYHLTSLVAYDNSADCSWIGEDTAATVRITATSPTAGALEAVSGHGPTERRWSSQYQTDGPRWIETYTCFSPTQPLATAAGPFTASDSEFVLFHSTPDPSCALIRVYTRQ